MKTLVFVREIFKKYPSLVAINILLVILGGAIETCSLFAIGPLIDLLIHPDLQNVSQITHQAIKIMKAIGVSLTLANYLILFMVFIIASSVLRILVKYALVKTRYDLHRDLVIGTFEDFMRARWYFFSSSKSGTLLSTFLRETATVGAAFGAMMLFFANISQLFFYLAVPLYISWQVTLISFASAFLLSMPFMLLSKTAYQLGKVNTATYNVISSVIQESFVLAKVILGFGNQKRAVSDLSRSFDVNYRASLLCQVMDNAVPILYRVPGVLVLALALLSARHFKIPVSETAILLLGLLQVVTTIGNLAAQKNSIDSFFPSYEQVRGLREKAKHLEQATGSKRFEGFQKEIVIENGTFAYPGHDPVLVNINVKIPKGKMIAIAGESGSGKSTLIDMVMGFNEFATGRVALDGTDLRAFDVISYRKHIGYVPQESVLFNRTIKDNILWAKEDAGFEEIRYACRLANADDFIERFPNGYDTVVGDRGVRLSGGQVQRIALARAILRKPSLLILDEATSSLDTYSERLIQQAVETIAKETTVVVIAHRLSTIVNADYIYVLKKGQIVEEGTYSELIQMKGDFSRMVELQLLEK
ncbi:MAG: ABC transporter ATP-binding protein [Candidatus Omnitrophica bacterium]|nr:ABC transporter ATP-binding protein [Candidatus Omnitrophota bacterium]